MGGRTQAKCWDLPPFSSNLTNVRGNGFCFRSHGFDNTLQLKVLLGIQPIEAWFKLDVYNIVTYFFGFAVATFWDYHSTTLFNRALAPNHFTMTNSTRSNQEQLSPPHSFIFDILESPAFRKYCTWWVFSALYLAVPGFSWLYLALPRCAMIYLSHTATVWLKCFGIYRLKCSKALSGGVG